MRQNAFAVRARLLANAASGDKELMESAVCLIDDLRRRIVQLCAWKASMEISARAGSGMDEAISWADAAMRIASENQSSGGG